MYFGQFTFFFCLSLYFYFLWFWKLRKDLISAMDEANTSKEKVKVLSDDLRAKRQLTLEKDEQVQATKERVKTVATKSVEAFK